MFFSFDKYLKENEEINNIDQNKLCVAYIYKTLKEIENIKDVSVHKLYSSEENKICADLTFGSEDFLDDLTEMLNKMSGFEYSIIDMNNSNNRDGISVRIEFTKKYTTDANKLQLPAAPSLQTPVIPPTITIGGNM